MYSLVSAPVLGFDLARLQGGSAAADVLLRGLSLTWKDLEVLAAANRLDTWERAGLWQDVDAAARQLRSVRDLPASGVFGTAERSVTDSPITEWSTTDRPAPKRPTEHRRRAGDRVNDRTGDRARDRGSDRASDRTVHRGPARPDVIADDTPPAEAAATELVRALALVERAPIGTVDGLLHCARHDVLSWTWYQTGKGLAQSETASSATVVLCDALAASYLRDLLPPTTRRRLAGGWVTAARDLPIRAPELGPNHAAVHGLLRRLRACAPVDLERRRRSASTTRRNISVWAPAVHSASWAVYLSGRLRPAAAAQLLLVQAVEDAGVTVAERAAGVWNLLSGAVQALVVRDLLDAGTLHRLLNPYLAALGPAGLD
jgi:hypothetical protein